MSQARVFLPSPPPLLPVPVCPCLSLAMGLPSPSNCWTWNFKDISFHMVLQPLPATDLRVVLHGCPRAVPATPCPQPCCAPAIRLSMWMRPFTFTKHHRLTWPLCSHRPLVYMPMIQQMIWTQQKIQPRLEESTSRNNPAGFHHSPLFGFPPWAWSASSFTHFVQRLLSRSFPTTSTLTAETPSFQAVPFASLPSWLLIFSAPENSIFFPLSLLIYLLLGSTALWVS